MLWNVSVMIGFSVVTSDGDAGIVHDFIFEDRDFTIEWLVVKTGTWFAERHIFVPVSKFGHPDAETRHFMLNMSKAQMQDCLSGDVYPLNDNGFTAHFEISDQAADSKHSPAAHFRSLGEMIKAIVEATDGPIGHAEDFLMDCDRWQIQYVVVHEGRWWKDERRLVSPFSIIGLDPARSIIELDVTGQRVQDSPSYAPEQVLDGAFETAFQSHYGLPPGKELS